MTWVGISLLQGKLVVVGSFPKLIFLSNGLGITMVFRYPLVSSSLNWIFPCWFFFVGLIEGKLSGLFIVLSNPLYFVDLAFFWDGTEGVFHKGRGLLPSDFMKLLDKLFFLQV